MKKFNPIWLPYMGAFVQAVLFGLAGYSYFDLGLWGAGAGLGVGAVVNLSMAVASSRVSDIAKSRKPLAYLSLIGLFCLSPVIICSSLGWSIANLSWSLSADLSILLTGAIAGGSLIAKDQPAKSEAGEKPTRTKRQKSADKPAEPATEPALAEVKPAFVCSCGKTFATQPALNAHKRAHKQVAGYAVSFEPITKEKVKP
jgi:hypothetical protein